MELNDVIAKLERCEELLEEMENFSAWLGIQFQQEDIPQTFQNFQAEISSHQHQAESEKQLRIEREKLIQELNTTVGQMEEGRSGDEAKLQEQKERIQQLGEMLRESEGEKGETQKHLQIVETGLLQELHEEKKCRIAAQNQCLDAEGKATTEEVLRKKAESAYHDALSILDRQRVLLKDADQENVKLQLLVKKFEKEKEHLELKYSTLCGLYEESKLKKDRYSRLSMEEEIRKRILEKAPAQSVFESMPCQPPHHHHPYTRDEHKERRNLAGALVLPPLSSQVSEISPCGISHHHPGGDHGSSSSTLNCPKSLQRRGGVESFAFTQDDGQKWSFPTEDNIPPSVVSGPVVYSNSFQQNNGQICFGNGSIPMNFNLTLKSESADSLTAEELGFDESTHPTEPILNAYDIGGTASSIHYTEDYDSVNGGGYGSLVHPVDRPQRMNPLQWAWEQRGNVVAGVTSSVQNAARTGVKMSKSLLAWATVLAVTAGTVGISHRDDIHPSDFSEEDEEDTEDVEEKMKISDSSLPYRAHGFIG